MTHLSLSQHLLLQACFKADEVALRAWEAHTDIEAPDSDSFTLLPLLKAAADQHDWTLNESQRIGGIVRYHWTQNALHLRRLDETLHALHAAAVEPVMLGDVVLARAYVARPELYPIYAFNFLLAPRDLASALAVVQFLGWTFTPQQHPGILYCTAADRPPLTIRTHAFPGGTWDGADDDLWSRSRTLGDLRLLSPADQLLHTIVTFDPRLPARSVATAAIILLRNDIDWETLIATARHYGQAHQTAAVLHDLRQILQLDIPTPALKSLRRSPYRRKRLKFPRLARWTSRLLTTLRAAARIAT